MKYDSVEHAVQHHVDADYPDLRDDLMNHDFQRRRVASSARFVRPGDRVLDVACNAGYFAKLVPQAEVHGVDVNPNRVAEARLVMASAQVAPAEALPFPDRHFDLVNVSGLLEQVFDCSAVMREAARVSRRSVTGNTVHEAGTWGRHRIEKHQWQARSWSEAELRALLAEIGTVQDFGTIDIGTAPQCFYFHVQVPQ